MTTYVCDWSSMIKNEEAMHRPQRTHHVCNMVHLRSITTETAKWQAQLGLEQHSTSVWMLYINPEIVRNVLKIYVYICMSIYLYFLSFCHIEMAQLVWIHSRGTRGINNYGIYCLSWNIAVATLEVLKDNDKTFNVPALGADGQGISDSCMHLVLKYLPMSRNKCNKQFWSYCAIVVTTKDMK